MYKVTYCSNHTCVTSTTPMLTLPTTGTTNIVETNSQPGSAATLAQDIVMVAAAEHPSSQVLSTGIQLGINWMPSSLVEASSTGEASSAQVNMSTTGTVTRVMALADAMFNSGATGGGNSMDVDDTFSSHDQLDW